MDTTEQWLTYQQAAEQLGCSVKTIRRRVGDGTLKAARRGVPATLLISAEQVAKAAQPAPVTASQGQPV